MPNPSCRETEKQMACMAEPKRTAAPTRQICCCSSCGILDARDVSTPAIDIKKRFQPPGLGAWSHTAGSPAEKHDAKWEASICASLSAVKRLLTELENIIGNEFCNAKI